MFHAATGCVKQTNNLPVKAVRTIDALREKQQGEAA